MIYCGDDLLHRAIAEKISKNKYDILIVNKSYFDIHAPFNYLVDSLGYTTSILTSGSRDDVEYAVEHEDVDFETSNNILANSFKINSQASIGTLSIGNCISNELQFSLLNVDFYWIRKGVELQVFYVVEYLGQKYYVAAGVYIVDTISHSQGNHKYVCYDYMQKFDDLYMDDANTETYMGDSSIYNTQKVKGFLMWLRNKGYPIEDTTGNLFVMVNPNFYKNNLPERVIGGVSYFDNWLQSTNIGGWFDYTMNGSGIKYTIRDILSIIGKVYGVNFLIDERGYLSHTWQYKYRTGEILKNQNNVINYTIGDYITLKGYRFFTKKNVYVAKPSDSTTGFAILTLSNRLPDETDIKQIYGTIGDAIGVYNTNAYSNEQLYDISCTTLCDALVQAGDKLSINVDGTIKYGYITECTHTAFGSTLLICRLDIKKYDITQTKYTQFSDAQYNEIKNMQ